VGKLLDAYRKLSLGFYEKLKSSCDKCNGEGIIKTSPQTFVDCNCTKIFLKYKEFIKSGISINYLIGGYKTESDIFDDENKNRINKLIKYLMRLNQLSLSGSVLVTTSDDNSECTSLISNKITKYLVELEKSAILIKGIDIIRAISNYDFMNEMIEELNKFQYLIIDNFPTDTNKYLTDKSSFSHIQFMQFLSYRLSANLKTIICCDGSVDSISKNYSDEIFAFLYKNYLQCIVTSLKGKQSATLKVIKENPEYAEVFSDIKISSESKSKGINKKPTRGQSLI